MKDVKYKLIDTLLYDYSLIEEKLTRLSNQGWHLEKIGTLAWKFRRGEPKQVRYAVTYAPSASAFNSRTTEAEEDLTDLCAQAGWIRVANMAQLHVYRNDDPNAVPLETDENERLNTIRKCMWKQFFPTELLMVVIFLMQFFMHFSTMTRSPVRTLSSPMMLTTLGVVLFVSIIHMVIALNGLLWLRRAQREVDSGEGIPVNRFYRRFRWVIWVFLIAYLLCLLWTVGLGFLSWVLVTSAAALLITAGGISLCKKLNAPKWVNMVVPAGLCAAVIAVLIPLLIFGVDSRMNEALPPAEHLPLTLTQLTGETDTERQILEESSTFLSSYGRYWDTGAEDVRLNYTIVDVKCPLFYDMLLNEQEAQFQQAAHYSIAPEVSEVAGLFGAEYARHALNDSLGDRWLICWDSRIVHLKASWELTEAQLAIIADTLKPQ